MESCEGPAADAGRSIWWLLKRDWIGRQSGFPAGRGTLARHNSTPQSRIALRKIQGKAMLRLVDGPTVEERRRLSANTEQAKGGPAVRPGKDT